MNVVDDRRRPLRRGAGHRRGQAVRARPARPAGRARGRRHRDDRAGAGGGGARRAGAARRPEQALLATGNAGKARELRAVCSARVRVAPRGRRCRRGRRDLRRNALRKARAAQSLAEPGMRARRRLGARGRRPRRRAGRALGALGRPGRCRPQRGAARAPRGRCGSLRRVRLRARSGLARRRGDRGRGAPRGRDRRGAGRRRGLRLRPRLRARGRAQHARAPGRRRQGLREPSGARGRALAGCPDQTSGYRRKGVLALAAQQPAVVPAVVALPPGAVAPAPGACLRTRSCRRSTPARPRPVDLPARGAEAALARLRRAPGTRYVERLADGTGCGGAAEGGAIARLVVERDPPAALLRRRGAIGIADSGFDRERLGVKMDGESFVGGDVFQDELGHGTLVASLAAGHRQGSQRAGRGRRRRAGVAKIATAGQCCLAFTLIKAFKYFRDAGRVRR